MLATPLTGCDTSHHPGAIFDTALGVKAALATRDSLNQKPGVFINENAHCLAPFAAWTALRAPS